MDEIKQEFVDHRRFAASTTRADVWDGFSNYLAAWAAAEHNLGVDFLKAIWIAGSFTSSEIDPNDIDISPFYDSSLIEQVKGKPGVGQLKNLFEQRSRVVEEFKVEPFAVPWRPVISTLLPSRLTEPERSYLANRGGLDDWWQRTRPGGKDEPPTLDGIAARRGYLEVMVRD
ncbi:hypothetical protein LRX77_00210 [Pseudoclavibacter sp. 13-3]|nr:hypothetical protein [Pseudoclavibacter sp. 13-3]MCD7100477.1 hypothetical protein [Pseudoclavibacter sp. 13-3]